MGRDFDTALAADPQGLTPLGAYDKLRVSRGATRPESGLHNAENTGIAATKRR